MTASPGHVLALCGGVGGAKMAFGLTRILAPEQLTIVVNTGDDFEHLGLSISPDIDTVVYTLAGLANRERGWGLEGETYGFLESVRRLGGEDWFMLGDRDLATHVLRTQALAAGESLSAVTARLVARLGVRHVIAPMSDQRVSTWIDTDEGPLAFQHYFARRHCEPAVRRIRFEGAAEAQPSPAFAAALARPDLSMVLICPSNPYLSIDPLLAVPGVRSQIRQGRAPCVTVSPVVGGQAIKGPTVKLMRELGVEPSAAAVAAHYAGLIDGLVLDLVDVREAAAIERRGVVVKAAATMMRSDEDRVRVAREALDLGLAIGRREPAEAPQ